MVAPTPARPSPLRGLAAGVVLALILFPTGRHLAASSVWAIAGVFAGGFAAAFVYAVATARRR